jgi:hypothetical protein
MLHRGLMNMGPASIKSWMVNTFVKEWKQGHDAIQFPKKSILTSYGVRRSAKRLTLRRAPVQSYHHRTVAVRGAVSFAVLWHNGKHHFGRARFSNNPELCKINYGSHPVAADEIRIEPHPLLFEKGINRL